MRTQHEFDVSIRMIIQQFLALIKGLDLELSNKLTALLRVQDQETQQANSFLQELIMRG